MSSTSLAVAIAPHSTTDPVFEGMPVALALCATDRSLPISNPRARARFGALYDVLITDVGFPDGSGWELVGEARQSHPAMYVGVVTGWEPTVHGAGAGAADFIMRKPLRAAELLASLSRLGALPDSGSPP